MIVTNIYTLKYSSAKLTVLLLVLLCMQGTYANDQLSSVHSDYSQGMRAYMADDFELSQMHWLNAAKHNDAKSMFNLGLLHELGKISNADLEKAETWYRLAGKHGYAAADFHLVKLKMTDSEYLHNNTEEMRALLLRSSENGFTPAEALLAELVGDTSIPLEFNKQQQNKLETTEQQNYLTEDWIASKTPTNWTIQILAFKDKNKVHDFIDRHNLNNSASYFIERNKGEVLYKLIYGSYSSKQQAEKARDNLSTELRVHGPWLRTIASVQALITAN